MMKTPNRTKSGLGFLLARAHGAMRQKVAAVLEGSGLHLGHVAILSMLAEQGSTQAALCAATGIEKSSMVLFVDALEQGGWVERQRHPSDRRAYLVVLTSAGRERLAKIGPMLAAAEREALAALSPADQALLADMLTRLVNGRAE
jgi:DNA-binding MarR family transcriptional regulator